MIDILLYFLETSASIMLALGSPRLSKILTDLRVNILIAKRNKLLWGLFRMDKTVSHFTSWIAANYPEVQLHISDVLDTSFCVETKTVSMNAIEMASWTPVELIISLAHELGHYHHSTLKRACSDEMLAWQAASHLLSRWNASWYFTNKNQFDTIMARCLATYGIEVDIISRQWLSTSSVFCPISAEMGSVFVLTQQGATTNHITEALNHLGYVEDDAEIGGFVAIYSRFEVVGWRELTTNRIRINRFCSVEHQVVLDHFR